MCYLQGSVNSYLVSSVGDSLSLWLRSELIQLQLSFRTWNQFFCFFYFIPGYPGKCFMDPHSEHSRTLHAFAEWVTQSMTDCVWSTKWAEDSTTASHSARQHHVALAEELSILHS